jgi:hypothetical protein
VAIYAAGIVHGGAHEDVEGRGGADQEDVEASPSEHRRLRLPTAHICRPEGEYDGGDQTVAASNRQHCRCLEGEGRRFGRMHQVSKMAELSKGAITAN